MNEKSHHENVKIRKNVLYESCRARKVGHYDVLLAPHVNHARATHAQKAKNLEKSPELNKNRKNKIFAKAIKVPH